MFSDWQTAAKCSFLTGSPSFPSTPSNPSRPLRPWDEDHRTIVTKCFSSRLISLLDSVIHVDVFDLKSQGYLQVFQLVQGVLVFLLGPQVPEKQKLFPWSDTKFRGFNSMIKSHSRFFRELLCFLSVQAALCFPSREHYYYDDFVPLFFFQIFIWAVTFSYLLPLNSPSSWRTRWTCRSRSTFSTWRADEALLPPWTLEVSTCMNNNVQPDKSRNISQTIKWTVLPSFLWPQDPPWHPLDLSCPGGNRQKHRHSDSQLHFHCSICVQHTMMSHHVSSEARRTRCPLLSTTGLSHTNTAETASESVVKLWDQIISLHQRRWDGHVTFGPGSPALPSVPLLPGKPWDDTSTIKIKP